MTDSFGKNKNNAQSNSKKSSETTAFKKSKSSDQVGDFKQRYETTKHDNGSLHFDQRPVTLKNPGRGKFEPSNLAKPNSEPERITVLGQPVDLVDDHQVLQLTAAWLSGDCRPRLIFSQNPEIIMKSLEDEKLASAMRQADILIPDGTGVVWALKRQGYNNVERVTGIDLMMKLLNQAQSYFARVYLLGAAENVSAKAALKIKKEFPGVKIAGRHHGFFGKEDLPGILEDINHSQADYLFVALGNPQQEYFLVDNRSALNVPVAVTVGGSLDVLAGKAKRAPVWVQKIKLEWLYRLLMNPRRLCRGMQIPRFIFWVLTNRDE